MGVVYDKGIEAARQLEAAGPFSPSAIPPATWVLLKAAFAGLFPHDNIGCTSGGCPNKISRAYLRVMHELRNYNQNNTAPLAQQSATSDGGQNPPTTNPNAARAATTNMANKSQFRFKDKLSYSEFGSQTAYTNANLTDKIARRILKNDPDARKLFVPFDDELLEGDTAAEGEHAGGEVTGAYGRKLAGNPAPLSNSTEHRENALGSAGNTGAAPTTPGDTAPNLTASTGGQATQGQGGEPTGVLSGKPLSTAPKDTAATAGGGDSTTSGAGGSTSTASDSGSASGSTSTTSTEGGDGTSTDPPAPASRDEQLKNLVKLARPDLEAQYKALVPAGDVATFANKTDLATAILDAIADSHEV